MFSVFTRPVFFFSICFVLIKRWDKCVNRRKCLLIRVLLFVCYYSACSHCKGVVNLLRMFNVESHAARTVEHGLAVTNRLFPTCSLVLEKHSSTNRSSFFFLVVYTFVLCGEPFYFPLCSSNLYLIFTPVLISRCASLILFTLLVSVWLCHGTLIFDLFLFKLLFLRSFMLVSFFSTVTFIGFSQSLLLFI